MLIITDPNIPFAKEVFSSLGEVRVVPALEMTPETIRDATVLLVRSVIKVNAGLLDGTAVKFVATATTGIDHVDTDYLARRSIGFGDAFGANANSVAEYMVAALMHLSRTQKKPLNGMTLGIIGVGNVGSKVKIKAEALGMKCVCNDPPKHRLTKSEMYLPLNEVLEQSDIVTLHVPLIKSGEDKTVRMADEGFLSRLRDGAILFNASRGKVIDENALKKARSRLSALVLDVWDNEPDIDLETLGMATIGTSHIAGHSFNGKVEGTRMIYEKACAFLNVPPRWNIDPKRLSPDNNVIDLTKSENPLFDAVERVYPIMDDDAALKKIESIDKEKRGAFFENMRVNYWKRFEFPGYVVKLSSSQDKEAGILRTLGFKI
jgi:erythronate-4-phosphate dehydrogenase